MIYKVLKQNYEKRKDLKFPSYPLRCRGFIVGDEFVTVDSDERTELDPVPFEKVYPSITDRVKAGEKLTPMGTPPAITGMSSTEVAQNFLGAFNGLQQRAKAARAAKSAPASEPAPAPELAPAPEPAK